MGCIRKRHRAAHIEDESRRRQGGGGGGSPKRNRGAAAKPIAREVKLERKKYRRGKYHAQLYRRQGKPLVLLNTGQRCASIPRGAQPRQRRHSRENFQGSPVSHGWKQSASSEGSQLLRPRTSVLILVSRVSCLTKHAGNAPLLPSYKNMYAFRHSTATEWKRFYPGGQMDSACCTWWSFSFGGLFHLSNNVRKSTTTTKGTVRGNNHTQQDPPLTSIVVAGCSSDRFRMRPLFAPPFAFAPPRLAAGLPFWAGDGDLPPFCR